MREREEIIKQCKLDGKGWKNLVLAGLADNYGEDSWKGSFVGDFAERFPYRTVILIKLKDAIGKNPEWDVINNQTLTTFRAYLIKNYSKGTAKSDCDTLKAFLTEKMAESPDDKRWVFLSDYKPILTIKRVAAKRHFFLSEKECEKIHRYATHGEDEAFVKRVFMTMLYTGAKMEDSFNISLDNCDSESDTLSYISSDSNKLCIIPVHRNLKYYLTKREERSIDSKKFTEILRSICFKAGVRGQCIAISGGKPRRGFKYNFITPMTARRSFATNLYLRHADAGTIAKMMGVTPSTVIEQYICAETRIEKKALRFFR